MKALILAAGHGTRLRPLTEHLAKPSLPVVGIPALWYGAWHLKRELQVAEFAINMGHAAQSIKKAAEDLELTKATGISFHFSDESSQVLGSSGVFSKIRSWVGKHTVAVCNADTISLPSWKKMLNAHREKDATLTLHLRSFDSGANGEEYTNVEMDSTGLVTALGPKQKKGVMFSGAYLIDAKLLERIPDGFSELRPTLLEPLIQEKKLYAVREDVEWIDTGTIASYTRAQFDLIKKIPAVRALVETSMREIEPQVWVSKKSTPVQMKFTGPVVMCGDLKGWAKLSSSFGPYFAGIELPKPAALASTPFRSERALVASNHIEHFD